MKKIMVLYDDEVFVVKLIFIKVKEELGMKKGGKIQKFMF